MNKRRLTAVVGALASALVLSACASATYHPPLTTSLVTINVDMESLNLSNFSQIPHPQALSFTLDLESKEHFMEQAGRTKDDVVSLWPPASSTTNGQKTALASGLCAHP